MITNKYISILLILVVLHSCKTETSKSDFNTSFETSNGTETATYKEVIDFYINLSETYKTIQLFEMGQTDSKEPLHLVTFSSETITDLSNLKEQNVLLINNGIHPGESDGIDASMMLLRDLAQQKITPPQNLILAVIPVYNIGGALNRNSYSRTNQNGPIAYGFRGNARNFDLNRDFIKTDTKNAKSFAQLFHSIEPDWFIDNHVSNGADYQYVLTHLFTQHNKLNNELGAYLHTQIMPQLEDSLQNKNWDITPYVNVFNDTPEKGFSQFMDNPRYSTGYTTLFGTIGMMVETHMLKPYKDRVEGTYELMKSFMNIANLEGQKLTQIKKESFKNYIPGTPYPIQWTIDSSQNTILNFKGYEATEELSIVTGKKRLKYHIDKPFTKPVDYYNYFTPSDSILIPEKYIIPKGFWPIIEALEDNAIVLNQFKSDTTIEAEVYHIFKYETYNRVYEGHYPHYNTKVTPTIEGVAIQKGDYWIDTKQPGVRYLLETLEPEAVDSFFNWNYFDTLLQQKEGFSPYVWEDLAMQFLKENPEIDAAFKEKKKNDENFKNNWYAQLDWIHKKSPYYEKAHLRYPIVRVLK